jgi:hypothetical protein
MLLNYLYEASHHVSNYGRLSPILIVGLHLRLRTVLFKTLYSAGTADDVASLLFLSTALIKSLE